MDCRLWNIDTSGLGLAIQNQFNSARSLDLRMTCPDSYISRTTNLQHEIELVVVHRWSRRSTRPKAITNDRSSNILHPIKSSPYTIRPNNHKHRHGKILCLCSICLIHCARSQPLVHGYLHGKEGSEDASMSQMMHVK